MPIAAPLLRHELTRKLGERVALQDYWIAKMLYLASQPDRSGDDPVLVYTVGKVASKSVAKTIESTIEPRPVLHIHTLAPRNQRASEHRASQSAKKCRGSSKMRNYWMADEWEAQRLARTITNRPYNIWDVVTLVRDPIARNIAAFFQNLEGRFDYQPLDAIELRGIDQSAQELEDMFTAMFVETRVGLERVGDPLNWFDEELQAVFGIDVYSKPFSPTEFTTFEGRTSRLLLLRAEDLDSVGPGALSEFLGVRIERIHTTNTTEDKAVGALYSKFKQSLSLPEWYVKETYSSRYATHFYQSSELASMASRWLRRV